MRILRVFFIHYLLIFSITTIHAQKKTVTINEPETVKKLMAAKKSNNPSTTTTDKYKIQLVSGKNSDATEAQNKFKKLFPAIDISIIYTSPSYKVLVGNFKTRLEAEKNLKDIKSYFDQALIIKPGK
ncbi:MAG: SPOR domain-containing protein [Flavobacteriaceae bacterium]|jgi:CO dehydrogenase/acetyl-CoA synthase epsilon subunit|nr:SPOR domain-containing protein [Flavobacteriaceae bacterium]